MKSFAQTLQLEANKQYQGSKTHLSPCCNATIFLSLADGVLAGNCGNCREDVSRVNPRTGVAEWLDGHSIWHDGDLRPMDL